MRTHELTETTTAPGCDGTAHPGVSCVTLAKVNTAMDAVLRAGSERAGADELERTLGWPAEEAVYYARVAQVSFDNVANTVRGVEEPS